MTTRTGCSIGLAALLGALAPGLASAATDPVTQLGTDVSALSAAVTSAHDTLLADLAKVTTDATNGDRAAAKADLGQFRTDHLAAKATLATDRAAVLTDLQAVRAAKAGSKTLAQSLKSVRASNQAELAEVRAAAVQARAALKAAAKSGVKGGTA